MESIVQDIQFIRSLRKDIRDPKLASNILKSIETIHSCIKSGTDLNGWKKVDWRGQGLPSKTNSVSSNSHYKSGHSNSNSKFFSNSSNNRNYQERTDNTSHYVFNGRSKMNGLHKNNSESISIPLTGSISPASSSNNIAHVNNVSSDGFRTAPHKYVSKFKKNSDKVEDTILNTIILGKLNKFSEQNYSEIKEFITHIIDSGQTDMIKCFMKLVFEKAASEEMFCPLYAKLLSELSARYPILLTEMANLYAEYMEIFEDVDENIENYNEVCKRNVEKKYRRGYSQFLAELIKHDVIDTDTFIKTVNKIITQIENNIKNKDALKQTEEYADCFMKIMKAIQTNSNVENECDGYSISDSDEENNKENIIESIRQILKNDMYNRIQPLTVRNTDNIGLSNKSRFTLLDIYEGIDKF